MPASVLLARRPAASRPVPLAQAPMIPLSAAGSVPLFLFGTLMDRDVLALVLKRPLQAAALETARLDGFRRERARGASWPLLVAAPGEAVEGCLLGDLATRDIGRINHYEGGEYRAELHTVRLANGTRCRAWLYMAREHRLASSGEPWELERWQAHGKHGLLARCPRWMGDCPG